MRDKKTDSFLQLSYSRTGACAANIFNDVQPLVQSALDGFNVSIFAYGQSNSGKMHTMVSLSNMLPLNIISLGAKYPNIWVWFFK